MSRDTSREVTENWAEWLQVTAEHVPGAESRSFGAIGCTSVGMPIPMFNQAFVFDEPDVDDLNAAVKWLSGRGVPFWVTAPSTLAHAVAAIADEVGLEPTAGPKPGMVLAPLPEPPEVDADIRRVADAAALDHFAVVTSEVFGGPIEGARTVAPASMLDDDRTALFVAYVDGEIAACGQLLRSDDVAGVYGIGVREPYRRRGLGEAITWAVLAAGRDSGCTIGALQASPLGEPVYDRMGFETVTQYRSFAPAAK